MNCKVIILFLFVQLTLVPSSATVWQVYLGSNFFAPESLVVASGDTVVWTNLEGTHNIVEQSVPPLFTSGAPAPPPWSYAFVFSLPLESYSYHCDVHAPEMSGYVTVIPYGTPPNIGFDNNYSVPQNAHVGRGFRMTVRATDEDQDLTGYALSFIDTNQWSDWSPFPAFLICDTSLGLFPENTTLISNSVLADGTLDIYFRAIDSRQFVSPIILRTIVVEEGHRPVMDTTVTGVYAQNDIYPDGSVYFLPSAEVALTFRAYPPHYGGVINSYRLRDAAGIWSEWFSSPTVTFTALSSGEYPFRIVARDVAGELSDTVDYTLRVMEFALSDTIVIVDETRNGNGVPGSPSDAQVDSFYHSLVTGYPYRDHDYTTNQFVSPYNLRNAGLLIWHADDRSELRLSQNIRVLGEFLDRGGRLILSGWDLMGAFTGAADSANFSTTSFAFRYLGAIAARRIPASSNTGRGFAGQSGFPSVLMDSTKLPPSWHGAMDRLWTFVPRDTTEIIGTLQVTNSGQNPLEGRPAAYLYDGAFRLAVFGVPLYFGITQEVQALMNILLPIMTAPVASPPEALAPVASFALHQNYPNPFNGSTQITFSIPRTGLVSIRIYDVLGRQVAYLGESRMTAGTHRVVFDGSALASGIYFVHLRSEEFSQSRKMVLLK